MRRLFRVTKRRSGRSDGATMVEAALALTLILVLFGAIVQLVLIVFTSVSLHQAAMAAGRAAILQSADDAMIIQTAKDALIGSLDKDLVTWDITEGQFENRFTAKRIQLNYPVTNLFPMFFGGGSFSVMAANIYR